MTEHTGEIWAAKDLIQRKTWVIPLFVEIAYASIHVHLLRTSDASVDEVAARVGYADATTLRNLLRRRLKLGIKEIRRSA